MKNFTIKRYTVVAAALISGLVGHAEPTSDGLLQMATAKYFNETFFS